MNNALSTTLIATAIILSTGCATPARVDQMVSAGEAQYRTAATPLRNNLALKEVTGGRETNPMWVSNVGSSELEQALEESLKAVGLLAARQGGEYLLTADLMKLDQPMLGLDMTVTSAVRYIVTERATGKSVFDETLTTPYTARFSDALLAPERLKLANEGAIRTNIGKLLERLVHLKFDKVAVAK